MIKAHKIRLHPTSEQANYFARAAGTARFTFNWALAEWRRQYEAGGKPNATALKKQFNAIRKEQFPWSYAVTKCAVEGAFMDVAAVLGSRLPFALFLLPQVTVGEYLCLFGFHHLISFSHS